MHLTAPPATVVLDEEALAWRFDSRGLTNGPDAPAGDFEWLSEYERGWDAGVARLHDAGLRPADDPYRAEEYPDGWVSYYRLELA